MTSAAARTGVTTYATPSDREVVITRIVAAPRRVVFDAWTNPKVVPQWLLGPPGWTMPVCEIDLRPGGRWHYVWRKADGTEMPMTGRYREVVPPERVVHTESWGPEWPETVNTMVLTESGGKTTIEITILYPSKEARDAALRTGMKDGMDMGFARLDELLPRMG
jgi:uncharacterized protein YndB with AHSA1/START domain